MTWCLLFVIACYKSSSRCFVVEAGVVIHEAMRGALVDCMRSARRMSGGCTVHICLALCLVGSASEPSAHALCGLLRCLRDPINQQLWALRALSLRHAVVVDGSCCNNEGPEVRCTAMRRVLSWYRSGVVACVYA